MSLNTRQGYVCHNDFGKQSRRGRWTFLHDAVVHFLYHPKKHDLLHDSIFYRKSRTLLRVLGLERFRQSSRFEL